MIEGAEIPAFSSCRLPFCFTREREVLFKVMAIENACKNKPRKAATILVPSFPDELLQGLEGTAGIGKLPNSNLQEQKGLQGSKMEYGELAGPLSQHLPAGAWEGTESGCCCRRSTDAPGHISRSKKHLGDGARVLTAELYVRGTDGQSKDSMQLEFGRHGNKVIDRNLA